MKRIVGYVLVLIVLSGIAYAVYLFAPRVPTLRTGPAPEAATSTEVTVQEKVITESTDTYRIEAHYPQFDIPSVDEKRSEEHTSELQSQFHLVCRLLLEKHT